MIWILAVTGVVFSVFVRESPRWVRFGLYIAMGWFSLFIIPALYKTSGSEPVALMVCGGVLYSVGAIVYATKQPDPWPDTFGFHEILPRVCHRRLRVFCGDDLDLALLAHWYYFGSAIARSCRLRTPSHLSDSKQGL